tara:strand:+ start:924 stop:1736 length:813 start_codon:yes stop_codon:yes gene_type:complete
MRKSANQASIVALLLGIFVETASAHDPVFGVGPHTLYKGGVEIHVDTLSEKSGSESTTDSELRLKYGLTGDWVAGIGAAYIRGEDGEEGRGPTNFSTKYRFWRHDTFGAQESAAVLGAVILDDGDRIGRVKPKGNDYLLGLTYGYEGRKWYRWASARRRFNADTTTGAERPDVWLLDLAGGIRFVPTEYNEPDWVWMLELNGEIADHVTARSPSKTRRRGGNEWFLSPGLMWTYRNFAIKAGMQISVLDDLEQPQEVDDYRAKIEFEWHL